jgi:phosphatidylserine decarboxylase
MKLAKWGYGELAVILIANGLLASIFIYYGLAPIAAIPLILAGIGVYFFRDPERHPPAGEGLVLSPADGTIQDIGEVDEPRFIQGKALRIGIFMSVFSVHVNRTPVKGRVAYLFYKPGNFLAAMNPQAIDVNESFATGFVTSHAGREFKLLMRQISGVLARKIICVLREGEEIAAGERLGMIKFGSRAEIYIPIDVKFEIAVAIGQKVTAGETVLGKLL